MLFVPGITYSEVGNMYGAVEKKKSKLATVIPVVIAIAGAGFGLAEWMSADKSRTLYSEELTKNQEYVTTIETKDAELAAKDETIASLEEQLAQYEKEKAAPKYVMGKLNLPGEGMINDIRAYLSGILGVKYDKMSNPSGYNLLHDYCYIVYDAMGIKQKDMGKITRNLPDGYAFKMPELSLSEESGKWRLSGKYENKGGTIEDFVLKEENY